MNDLENPFANYDESIFELSWDKSSIQKYHLSNNNLEIIDNYGIYDYFNYSDNVYRLKMVSALFNDRYVINTEQADKSQHYGMQVDINIRFGGFNCFIASIGDELNIFADDNLTSNQLNMLIDIFEELKLYYFESKKNKKILFVGIGFKNKFDNFENCSDIDKIINSLTDLKNELREENLFSEDKIL